MSTVYFILALPCFAWGIVSSIAISVFLYRRGMKIDFLFFRVHVLRYIQQYHKITKQQNGKPGPWFYSYIVSMNLALVFVIVGTILKYM